MMLFLIGGSKAAFAQSYYAYGNGGTWNGASTYFLHTEDERYFYTPPAPSMSNATFLGYMPSFDATCGGLQEMLRAMPYDTVWDILYKIYNNIPNEYSFQKKGVYFTTWNGVEHEYMNVKVSGTSISGSYEIDRHRYKININKSVLSKKLYQPGTMLSINYCMEVEAIWAKPLHTHNSSGIEYNQGNENQHIKYTYCNAHGSDHSQNRNSSYENHSWATTRDWYNYDNTTMHQNQKCSLCGRTRTNSKTRTYNIDLNINNPQGTQARNDGGYGFAYVKVSLDNTNWSNEVTNETSIFNSRQYGDKIYIKYIRPYYDYLEFGSISVTNNKGLANLGNNTWCYTVSDNPANSTYTGGVINIYTAYKHTTLTLNPNGGFINGNTEAQTLSPKIQYSTSQWNNLSTKKPSRTGYTFTGWYDQASGGTKIYNVDGTCVRGTKYFDSNGNSLMTSDITLYAQWSINTYHIYYTLYGSSASVKRAYTITDNAFNLPTPTLTGYTFKGWVGGVDKNDLEYKKHATDPETIRTNITITKGNYGDHFYRAIFEKNHSVDSDGNTIDDVYVAQSKPLEKFYGNKAIIDNDVLRAKIQEKNSTLTSFIRVTEKPAANVLTTNNVVSTSDSDIPVYAWANNDGTTISWYSEATYPKITSLRKTFNDCSKLTDISGLSTINTGNVTDMYQMFSDCTHLTDLSAIANWNISNVINMHRTFYHCLGLTNLSALASWNTSKVTDIGSIFGECEKLTDISALASWDTSKMKDIGGLFLHCYDLTDISALSSWNTKNATNMDQIFVSCEKLADISALSNWNTENATRMDWMFYNCESLSDISAISSWNLANVTETDHMFRNCNKLSDISALANWDTGNVTDMNNMFRYCISLTDASGINNWDISKVMNFEEMFKDCHTHPTFTKRQGTWDDVGTFIPTN